MPKTAFYVLAAGAKLGCVGLALITPPRRSILLIGASLVSSTLSTSAGLPQVVGGPVPLMRSLIPIGRSARQDGPPGLWPGPAGLQSPAAPFRA